MSLFPKRARRLGLAWVPTSFIFASLVLGACAKEPQGARLNGDNAAQTTSTMPADGVYDNASDGSPVFPLVQYAKTSLDIEIYEMNDPKFRAAVLGAKKRGVDVRIVIEPQPVGVCNSFADQVQQEENQKCTNRKNLIAELENAGIKVVPFSKQLCAEGYRCFQHGKLMIVDRSVALMSTGNFNSSSFCNLENNPETCNRDYTVVTRDQQALNTLQASFDRDLSGGTLRSPVMISSSLTVSPNSSKEFLGFIDGAQKSLKIQAQYLREPTVNEAIMRARQRGVKVQAVIASACSFSTYLDEQEKEKLRAVYQPMLDAGVEMTFFTKANTLNGRPAYMHAKLMIADDQRAWVGSINGSPTSLYGNREYGMFFSNGEWVGKLVNIFASDFSSQQNEVFETNLTCEKEKALTSGAQAFEWAIDADML